MLIQAIKTSVVRPGDNLYEVLDRALPSLGEGSVVAIALKIVAICEGRVVPIGGADKIQLIKQETSHYLPPESNPYNVTISIARHHLIASGGIDESNGDGNYILWPEDAQKSANAIREHLCKTHGIANVGVILTDSTTRPFQWGTTGIAIAYSGFMPLKSYIGTTDIFGRTLKFQKNNIMNGLAAAAVLLMGEGSEQTPLALIRDVPFVEFVPRNPTDDELAVLHISLEEDLYAPLLKNAPWRKGDLS